MEQSDKKTTLDNYEILSSLGKGAYSRVKLGKGPDGKNYALKIFKHKGKYLQKEEAAFMLSEIVALQKLKHKNLINLIDYKENGILTKANGKIFTVIYLVLELATNGELFDFIAMCGRFEENLARYYFRQLIDGIDYIHQKGYSHRDLKPENIFIDEIFDLKIADFGFAAQVGKNKGSFLHLTSLGTVGYQAPEVVLGLPYNGEEVDVFSSGVILFIMVSGNPPFNAAKENDGFYKFIWQNLPEKFWTYQSRNKPGGEKFYSEEFKLIMLMMLQNNPTFRISIADLKATPWYNGEVPSREEVCTEMERRKQFIESRKNQQVQKKVAHHPPVKKNPGYKSYGHQMKEEKQIKQRAQEPYRKECAKNREFITECNPDYILEDLDQYFYEKKFDYKISDEQYKIRAQEMEQLGINITIRIFNIENTNKSCIQFARMMGDCLTFHSIVDDIQKILFECEQHIDQQHE